MALTQQQLDDFQRDGYLIVPDVFDAAQVGAALAAMEQIFYGKSYVEYLSGYDENPAAVSTGFCSDGVAGRAQFPCGPQALDCMIEKDEYLDMCEQLLGTDQISYNNAHLFMRSGPTDTPRPGYHIDHDTNCLLPPAAETGFFDYLNSGVYLHDVEADGAPMLVIPGSHRLVAERLPQWIEEGKFTGHSEFPDIAAIEEFAVPLAMTATAGSAAFYSSYLVHAAVPFANKRKQRAFWTLSLARADNQSWTKMANVWHPAERAHLNPFWTRTTPRVRTLFGWPPPGHDYYTPRTLELLPSWFPGMDLSDYQAALA